MMRRQGDTDQAEPERRGRFTHGQWAMIVAMVVVAAIAIWLILLVARPVCGCTRFSPTARTVDHR
jgi:hypothetical protein